MFLYNLNDFLSNKNKIPTGLLIPLWTFKGFKSFKEEVLKKLQVGAKKNHWNWQICPGQCYLLVISMFKCKHIGYELKV